MKRVYKMLVVVLVLLFSAFTTSKIISPKWVTEMTSHYDDDVADFVGYWYNSIAMQKFEEAKGIEQEVILAKLWHETHGGHLGAGRRGALFGIQRKRGSTRKSIKGYDSVDKANVDYAGYDYAWESISHFCDFIQKPLYQERFEAWREIMPDYPEWHLRLLSLQVHPERSKSKLAYAANGCKDGTKAACYNKRKRKAEDCIDFVIKHLRVKNEKWEGFEAIEVDSDFNELLLVGPVPYTE